MGLPHPTLRLNNKLLELLVSRAAILAHYFHCLFPPSKGPLGGLLRSYGNKVVDDYSLRLRIFPFYV